MAQLNPKQRQFLKGLAHALKPLFQVGKEGVTHTVLRSIQSAFNSRELLKIKVLDAAPESSEASGEKIAASLDRVEVVQVIGKTVVLYRPHPEKPKIKLPDSKYIGN
ncbi:MAG: ribosome assembly RNA-binding protein YhbY [Blastocatellia bacterium]